MKRRAVFHVPMCTLKLKKKAMKAAADLLGIDHISARGDKLIVVGDDVDCTKILAKLKNKVGKEAAVEEFGPLLRQY